MYKLVVTNTKTGDITEHDWVTDRCTIGGSDDNLVGLTGWRIPSQVVELANLDGTLSVTPISPGNKVTCAGQAIQATQALTPGQLLKIHHYEIKVMAIEYESANHEPLSNIAISENHDRQAAFMRIAQQAQLDLLGLMDQRRVQIEDKSEAETLDVLEPLIEEVVAKLARQHDVDQEQLKRVVFDETMGLGALEVLLKDPTVTEVMVNNFDDIYVEREGRLEKTEAQFSSPQAVRAVIDRIISPLGRRIDESSPIVDARLKDGSRVNAIIPPLAIRGPSITIRKFPERRFGAEDLIKFGSASAAMIEFLEACILNRMNVIVSGGTGSGKTTLLNILSNFIPQEERVITVEDAAELQLGQPHVVSLEARPANMEGRGQVTIRDLVKNCLRMRPDRIVVGECRGGEALDMLQAMNTGHDGSLTTAHANSPVDMLRRLEVMVLMAGMDLPVAAIREQVASAVDIIVQQTRFGDGSRRITKISEVTGIESGTIQLNDLFVFKQQGFDEGGKVKGLYTATGSVPTFYEELAARGLPTNMALFAND